MEQQGLWDRAERLRGAADETARLVQTFYLSFLLFGTYIAIIIGSTTDVQLLKSSPTTLPLLNVPLPMVGFYFVVPWLLLLFYFNLLLHLTLLAQKLHQLSAVLAAFTDAAAREEQRVRLFPFPFSIILAGLSGRWFLRMLLGLMVWATILLLPLLLLLYAQVRFLPYHDTYITYSHRFAVLVYLLLGWVFWWQMLTPARRGRAVAQEVPLWLGALRQREALRITRKVRAWWGLGLFFLTAGTMVFSWGIAVIPEEHMERWLSSIAPRAWLHVDSDRASDNVFIPTYWLFEKPGAFFHRNLQLQEQVLVAGEPSAKVVAALRSNDETKRTQALDEVAGLILTNRDLRGANFRDTLFPKGDLRGANLKGANLDEARVFAGNLSSFLRTKDSRCIDAAQQSKNVEDCQTNLQGAYLRLARLEGADLRGAQLQGADLRFAQLQGAALGGTQLQGADLQMAQLQGATLRSAQLQGATLWHAQLQGADLRSAQLQGATLWDAQLQGADLQRANIGSADVRDADLTWSDLRGLSQSPLDKETYEELEKIRTDTIRNKGAREARGNWLQGAVGRPTNLSAARSDERSVLCNNVELFRFCVTQAQSEEYADHRAIFLGTLGCDGRDAAIARGITLWHQFYLQTPKQQKDPILLAFIKHVTAIPEKDCPGWAALPADQKDTLRKLAGRKTSAR